QMSASLQNAASKANATLHVSITASDENYEKEQQEKEQRRQRLEQNALPSWHSSSTVGQNSSFAKDESGAEKPDVSVKNEEVEVKAENGAESAAENVAQEPIVPLTAAERKEREAQDVLAAYYADLAEREAKEDEEEEEEDDDDFDDFEDI
ncbi:hypothetical protein OXX80_004377, partial [Metschnikowia pulcherrima]